VCKGHSKALPGVTVPGETSAAEIAVVASLKQETARAALENRRGGVSETGDGPCAAHGNRRGGAL
jgi:hypothetical protein